MFRKYIKVAQLCVLVLIPMFGYSQGIATFSSRNPTNLVVCGPAQTFTLKISNTSLLDSIKSGKATVRLPVGFQYVASSVSSSVAVKQSNITNLNQPVFTIPTITPRDSVKFSISVSVNCSVIAYINTGGALRNFMSLSYNKTAIDSSYTGYFSIGIPSLAISKFTHQSYTGTIGDTINRLISITNTAAAPLSSFTFYIVKGNGFSTKSPGKTFTVSHDTLIFTYNSTDFKKIGNKDGYLDKGETIVVTEADSIISCSGGANSYQIGWGCGGSICQTYSTTSNVVLKTKLPGLVVTANSAQNQCYVISSANLQSITITDTGAVEADSVLVDIMQTSNVYSGYNNGYDSKIDISSIKIQYGSSASFTSITPDSTFANYPFSCLGTNPKGRFWIKIPVLKSKIPVTIEWNVYNCCISQGYLNSWGYSVSYRDPCGGTIYDNEGMGRSYLSNYQIFGSPVLSTTNLIGGDTETVYLENNSVYSNLLPGTGKTYLQYQFYIFNGIKMDTTSIRMVNVDNTIIWKPDSMRLVGGILHITFALPPPSGFSYYDSRLAMRLTGDTNTIGCNDTANMSYQIYYQPNPSCGCFPLLASGVYTFKINCINPNKVGMYNAAFSFLRTSYGLPDNNDDGFPDATGSLDFTKIRRDRAMYNDTLTAIFAGKVLTNKNYPSWKYAFADMKFTADYLTQLDVSLKIVDSTNKKTYTITKVPYLKSDTDFFYYYGTDTLRAAGNTSIPSNFLFKSGDSVYMTIRYKVTKNTSDVDYVTLDDDFYFSKTSKPKTQLEHYSVNVKPSYYYAVGYYFDACCSEDVSATGCSGATFSENFYLSIGNCCSNYYGGDIFPYEYRYWGSFAKMVVVLPDNFSYESAEIYYYPTEGQGKYGVFSYQPAASSVSGDTVFFDLTSLYKPPYGTFPLSDDGYAGTFQVFCQPKGNTPSTTYTPIQYFEYFDQSPFLGGGVSPPYYDEDYVSYLTPTFNLQAALPTVSSQADTMSWTVYISNTSLASSAYRSWVAFQNNSGLLTVDSVFEGKKWLKSTNGIFQLDTLAPNKTYTLKVKAIMKNCVEDTVRAIFGWDCSSYPDSLAAVKYQTQTFFLFADPHLPGLQTKSINPPDSLNLCDTANYSVLITNTQSAAAPDVNFEINLPPGTQIVKGGSKLRFPMTDTFSSISDPDSLSPYLYEYKSGEISNYLKNNGLAGFYDTTKSSLQLDFRVVNNCDYISGTNLTYVSTALDACGNVVSTNGLEEVPLTIIGAKTPYSGSLSITGQTSISGCGGKPSTVKLKFVNNGPVPTDTDDYMFIDFPDGINYVPKSLNAIHNSPSDTSLVIQPLGTTTRYQWKILSGVKAGDSIVYTINYASDGSLNCESFPVVLQSATTKSLYCVSTHIDCDIKVLTGITAANFNLVKPSISITGLSATITPLPPSNEKLNIKATIVNSGDTVKANSQSVIKFYYDADGDKKFSAGDVLIGTDSINTLIKPNSSYSENKTLTISPDETCGIIALWDTTKQNCGCAPAQAYYGPVPLHNAGNDSFLCSGGPITLGADSISGYSYSWLPATGLDNAHKAQPEMSTLNAGSTIISETYALTTQRIGCTTTDSIQMQINPALNVFTGYPDGVCLGGSVDIGGSPAASGGSGKYNYSWLPSAGLSNDTIANPNAKPSITTDYKLTVTDAKGCSVSDSILVSINPNPIVNAGPDVAVCLGDSGQLGGSPTASGSTSPYSYAWKPSTYINISNASNPKTGATSTTAYIIFVTDAKGCKNSDSVNFIVNQPPKIDAGANGYVCYGDSVTLGGSPTVMSVSGPNIYRWSPATGLSDTVSANPRAAPTTKTTYTLKVIDSFGCKNAAMVTITPNPQLNLSMRADRRICYENSTTIGGSASGGSSSYSYAWTPASSLNNAALASPTARPLSNTTYTLVVTDANGCTVSKMLNVYVNPLPSISAGLDDSLCKGDSVTLGGTSAYSYQYSWNPGKYLNDSVILTPKASPPATTAYILTATDSIGCKNSDTVAVNVESKTAINPPNLSCVNVINKNTITLSWVALPTNSQFSYYTIYRKAGSGVYAAVAVFHSRTTSSWTDTVATRVDSISYSYFITVNNHCGIQGKGSDTISSIVLTTKVVGDKTIILNWNKFSAKNNTYTVLYNSGSGYKTLTTLKGTSYTNRSCNLSATYKIEVVDTGCSSNSYPSPTIKLIDKTAPAVDTIIDATTNSWGQIQVNFTPSDSSDTKNYSIYRGDSSGAYSLIGTVTHVKGKSTYSYLDKTVSANHTRYFYKIRSTDTCGNVSTFSGVHSPVVLKGKPADYAARLYWSSYNGFGVKNYIVQLYKSGTWVNLSGFLPFSDTSYQDTLLPCNTPRYYRIKATANRPDSIKSYSDSIELIPFDTIRPLPPVITYITVLANGKVQINWTKSASNDVENYTIYKSVGGVFKALDSVGNVNTYTDASANTLVFNCYEVLAVDSCAQNRSNISAPHCSMALQVTNNGCEPSNYLAWTAYSGWDNVSKYEIYRSVNGGAQTLLDSTTTSTTFKDTGLNFHNNYCYQIKAYLSGGANVSFSNTFCKNVYFVDTPIVVVATKLNTSATAGKIKVQWVSQSGIPHLAFYRLSHSYNKAPYTLLEDSIPIAQDSFIHTGLNTKVGDHYYNLQTVDSCNILSEPSTVNKTMDLTFHVGELVHQLNWTPYLGWPVKYYVIQHAINNNPLVDEDTLPGNDTFYHKFPAPCNTRVVYRIMAVSYAGVVSYSDSMGGQAIDTVPSNAPTLENVSYLTNKLVRLDFLGSDSLDTYGYVVKRSEGGGSFITAGFVPFSSPHNPVVFVDTVNTQAALGYQIITEDSCLNLTPSQVFYPIHLIGKPENLSDSLQWTHFVGYGIKQYEVLIYNNGTWQNLANTGIDTSFFHDSLSCNVPRYYKIEGFDSAGLTTYSDSVSVTPFDTTRPATPVINYASVLSPTSVYLNWQYSTSKKVKDYEIDYKSSTSAVWRVFKTVRLQNSITITGLETHDTAYDFRVIAIDTCMGNRSLPGEAHQTVLLVGKGGNLVSLLSWSAYHGFAVNRYVIYKLINNIWTAIDSVGGMDTVYNDSAILCSTSYHYKILAYSDSGAFTSYSDSVMVQPIDTTVPPAPTIRYATVVQNGTIAVYWNKSVLSVNQYALSYKSGHGPWDSYGVLTKTYSAVINGLDTKDSIYSFRLLAIDSCSGLESPFSTVHTVVKIGGVNGNLSNTITWTSYQGFTVKEYYIYGWNNAWQLLDSVNGSTNQYVNGPLQCNVPRNYRIGALDTTGKYLSFSDSIQLIPYDTIKPAPPILYSATVLPNSTVQINWHWGRATSVNQFEIWRSVNQAAAVKIGTVIGDSTFIDNSVNPKLSNAYYLVAIDSCSTLDRSSPSATDTLMLISDKTGGCKPYIQINWTPYYTLLGGTDSFRIFKSENTGLYTLLATVPASQYQYTDSLVDAINHFSYRVEAVGDSQPYYSFSDTIGTTPWIDPRAKAPQLVYNSVVKTSPVNGMIQLQWNSYPFATDTFAKGYDLYGGNKPNGPFRRLLHTNNKSTTFYTVDGLNTSDSLNYFYLSVFNTCDLDGDSSVINSPIKLSLQNKNLEVDLSWKAYQTIDSVKAYKIYRSFDGDKYTLLNTVGGNQLSYIDTAVSCKHLYYYRISALTYNRALPESFSDSAGVTVFDTLKPQNPKVYLVSTNSTGTANGSILVTFKGNLKRTRAGYDVYYSTDSVHYVLGDSFMDLKTDTLVWQQSNLNTSAQAYSFYLTAFDSCGNVSSVSDTQAVVYLNAIALDHRDSLHWTAYRGWKSWHYLVEKKEANGAWFPIINLDTSTTYYVDRHTKCDTFYLYRIVSANNLDNLVSLSNEAGVTAFDTSSPIQPFVNFVTVTITSPKHGWTEINWNRSKSNDVAFYNIYRQSNPSGPWEEIASRLLDTFYFDSLLNTYRNYYSYRVEAADSCSSPNTSESIVSPSISLTAQAGDQKINLNWNAYTGWQPVGYEIIRNLNVIARVGGNVTSFVDTNVICPKSYWYIVIAINPNDTNLYAISSMDSAQPYDNIPPASPYLIRATVSQPNNAVSLSWTKPPNIDVSGYRILRQEARMNYFAVIDSITDPNDTEFTDVVNNISDSLCYKVEAYDYCGNVSRMSNPACVIIVQGQANSLANILHWNPYKQWPGGVAYYNLYRKTSDSTGYQLLDQFTSPEFIYNDTGFEADGKDYCYRIEAIENGGFKSSSWSTELCLVQQPVVWIPDAFTPNITVGINDLFGPKGLFIARYDMDIYNRWGERVYITDDSKPWDGTYRGTPAEEGVYLYHITVYSHNGKKYYFTGTIEVID